MRYVDIVPKVEGQKLLLAWIAEKGIGKTRLAEMLNIPRRRFACLLNQTATDRTNAPTLQEAFAIEDQTGVPARSWVEQARNF